MCQGLEWASNAVEDLSHLTKILKQTTVHLCVNIPLLSSRVSSMLFTLFCPHHTSMAELDAAVVCAAHPLVSHCADWHLPSAAPGDGVPVPAPPWTVLRGE